jgi:hypothetical protein
MLFVLFVLFVVPILPESLRLCAFAPLREALHPLLNNYKAPVSLRNQCYLVQSIRMDGHYARHSGHLLSDYEQEENLCVYLW